MSYSSESTQDAGDTQLRMPTMNEPEIEKDGIVPFAEDSSELPRQEYRFRSVGRNARLRTKLARVDQVLANETGWLSAASRLSLDGAVSGFLDSVRVQHQDLSRATGTHSRK